MAPDERDGRAFAIVFGLCTAIALALLWVPKYLPMTDLPLHAAQIAVWRDYSDPRFGYGEIFERHYFTPYLLGYSIARVFAAFTTTLTAVKATATLAVLAVPWSLLRLTRVLSADRWWSLIGFAIAFGYPFIWGLLNYLVAIPLGVLYLAYAIEYAEKTTRRGAVLIALGSVALFLAHGLVFAVCAGGSALFIAISTFRREGLRAALRALAPLSLAPLLSVAWAVVAHGQARAASIPVVYEYSARRLIQLPALTVGLMQDRIALAIGSILLFLMVAGGLRPMWTAARLAPFVFWLALYVALPRDVFDFSLLYPRLAVFAMPLLLIASTPRKPWLRPRLLHLALATTVLAWLGLIGLRFHLFDQEARNFDPLLARMDPGKRVRGLIFERATPEFVESSPFLHFPAWYQALKGGHMDFTFGATKTALIRYRPGKSPFTNTDGPFWPHRFDPDTATDYDYFVVHSPHPVGHAMLSRVAVPIAFVGRSGDWWLYRRVPAEP